MFAVVIIRSRDPFLTTLYPGRSNLYFLQEEGLFKDSLEEARWIDTREEAKVMISKLPPGYRRERPRIMTVGNIIDAELKFQNDRLKHANSEREKIKKLTKGHMKGLVAKAIKEGAKIFRNMKKDIPPSVVSEFIRPAATK